MTTTPEAYVQLSNDNTFITFYYDTLRDERYRESFCSIWGIAEAKQMRDIVGNLTWVPAWAGTCNSHKTTISSAVFDASFRDFRPTTTARWFQYFPRLRSIEGLEHLNTSQVKSMSKMFCGCSSLTALDLSSFDTSNVTDMSDMFQDCKSLISLDLSSFDTSNVTWMRSMFFCCNSLTSLDLSSFDTSEVRYMYNMFFGCDSLTTIYGNSSWNCENSETMFAGCTSLKGAVAYDESKTDASMANPETGYFTSRH